MDNPRGQFPDHGEPDESGYNQDVDDDETGPDLPPAAIGQDERRMQVRAYNFWASMLQDRNLPAIEDLDPAAQPDFGPNSVLLDFRTGVENPAIVFLGDKIAHECGGDNSIKWLAEIPSRSLLLRITDHYLQIISNQAPIGFEAEFVNMDGNTILYRGILLPFSSDGETIDYIYGVINWKELADQQTTDELLLQIDQALEPKKKQSDENLPLADWADGPVEESGILDLAQSPGGEAAGINFPSPDFGGSDHENVKLAEIETEDAADMGLHDWLASARELAQLAKGSEDRSRQALYSAIGRAYDFSLAAADAPEEFAEMVADAGLTVQERAPMTPLVKLVFGADYDKTRITEYASALSHAQRLGLGRGELAAHLAGAPGSLKGVVTEERRLRRLENGAQPSRPSGPSETLLGKLRALDTHNIDQIGQEGSEFTILVGRRLASGEMVVVGEVSDDTAMLQRAAKHLLK